MKIIVLILSLGLLFCACGKPDVEAQKKKAQESLSEVVDTIVPKPRLKAEKLPETIIIPPGYGIEILEDGSLRLQKNTK